MPLFSEGSRDYEKPFFGKVITDSRIDCSSPMETVVYTKFRKKLGLACYHCGVDITTDDGIQTRYDKLRESYGTVYPSCGDCAGFVTKRPKAIKKRPAPPNHAAKPPKKPKPSE